MVVVADTCVVVTPILPSLTNGVLMTNSGKFAHYAPGNTGYGVIYGSLADCVESAVAGTAGDRWSSAHERAGAARDRRRKSSCRAPAATGEALVLSAPISFWGGVDPKSGRIADVRHPQCGSNIAGTVLFVPGTIGSSSAAAVLLELVHGGRAPAAIVLHEPDAILLLGLIVAREMGWETPVAVKLDRALHAGFAGPQRRRVGGWRRDRRLTRQIRFGRTRSGGRWPSMKARMLMITFSPMSMRPSIVAEPICGRITTLPLDGQLDQLRVDRRLVLEDVETGAGDLAVLDHPDQRILVDDVAARRVDDVGQTAASAPDAAPTKGGRSPASTGS